MNEKTREVYTQIKDLSKEEIIKKMQTEPGFVPPKGQDRDEFMRFIAMSSDERTAFLKPDGTTDTSANEQGSAGGRIPTDEAGAGSVANAGETGSDWWKELGYDSEEKAKEAHKNLLDLTTNLKGTVDRLNANEGKRGSELKALREQNEALLSENSKLKETVKPKIEKPQKPKRPNPKDYGEDGVFSEAYQADRDRYDDEMESYLENLAAFNRAEVEKKVDATEEKLTKTVQSTRVETQQADEWDKLFNSDIPEFQKKFNLNTITPIRQISDCYVTINNPNATQEQKTSAQVFLKSLPKTDLDNYEKVEKAVKLKYSLDSGIPVPRYRTFEGALIDAQLLGPGKEFNNIQPSSLTPEEEIRIREEQRKKADQAVSSIPASNLANQDTQISQANTVEEKTKRLKELNLKYNVALNGGQKAKDDFERSQDYQDYIKLRQELSGRLPSYARK